MMVDSPPPVFSPKTTGHTHGSYAGASSSNNHNQLYHHDTATTTAAAAEEDGLDPLAQLEGIENITVDDLLSLGSHQHSGSTGSAMDDPLIPEIWRVHHPGVHMHMQENAKLPTFNLPINRSAVRTRKDSVDNYILSLNAGSAPAMKQSEAGFSKFQPPSTPPDPNKLAEVFLSRTGRHFHFEAKPDSTHGRPSQHRATTTTTTITTTTTAHRQGTTATTTDPLDALLAADLKDVDPTPLSEIRRRHDEYHASHPTPPPPSSPPTVMSSKVSPRVPQQQQQQQPPRRSPPPSSPGKRQHPQRNNQQPYRVAYTIRPVPLPIPTNKVSPPVSPFGIKGQSNNKNESIAHASSSSTAGVPQKLPPVPASTTVITTSTAGSSNPSASSFTTCSYKAAPSIYRASNQKARYGFGSNHVVPAVPPSLVSPRKRKSPDTTAPTTTVTFVATSSNGTNGVIRGGVTTQAQLQLSNTALTSNLTAPSSAAQLAAAAADNQLLNNGNNQGAAYERKKQRAKDARVKLNESIERLSVAISLAGTQSLERQGQWRALAAGSAVLNRQAALDICQECVAMADSAKKWDRPSFVGSAALLIQGLNAQCEALMRELVAVYQQHESDLGRAVEQQHPSEPDTVSPLEGAVAISLLMEGNPPVDPDAVDTTLLPHATAQTKTEASPDVPTIISDSSEKQLGVLEEDEQMQQAPVKRQRVSANFSNGKHPGALRTTTVINMEEDKAEKISPTPRIFGDHKLMLRVASFLDPVSLLRCLIVSKQFLSMNVFNHEQIWQDLAAARFGYFNVRQWHAKLDDDEAGVSTQSMVLYRSMDRANVMPTFSHEGLFLLGEARLTNKVCAWVFLVERSNGETLRTIRRRPDMPGTGEYSSLPVVELRTIVQHVGSHSHNNMISIRDQTITVDASTRRRGEEMREVDWDDRFRKRLENLDGTPFVPRIQLPERKCPNRSPDLCRLRLFDCVVIVSYIYARGCSTNSKFVQRSNFSKILLGLNTGVTVPLVIPFPRDASHLQH